MIGKILLTALVILVAFAFLRQRHLAQKSASETAPGNKLQPQDEINKNKEGMSELRLAAYMFLALTIGLAGLLYYYQWQDDRTLLTITLFRDGQSEPVEYQVYKYQLQNRSFVTVDGVSVTVAGSERMEIDGLE